MNLKPLLLLLPLFSSCSQQLASQQCRKGQIGKPGQSYYVYTLVRFMHKGQAIEQLTPIASHNPKDQFLRGALRFGAFYMVPTKSFYTRRVWVNCVAGRDTMHVLVTPYFNVGDQETNTTLIDSIPFHPGFYSLAAPGVRGRGKMPSLPTQGAVLVSLVAYYQKHAAALAKHNPFAGYCFPKEGPTIQAADGSPFTPAAIFADAFHRPCYRVSQLYQLTEMPPAERAELYTPPDGRAR